MTLTEDYEISAGVEDVDIGRGYGRRRARGQRRYVGGGRALDLRSDVRGVVTRGLVMSGACLAALIGGSMLHNRSAWTGLNTLPDGLPFLGRRTPSRFDARLAVIGIGTVVGGSLLVSILHQPLEHTRLGRSRIAAGIVAGLGSLAMDRLVMQRSFLPSMRKSLGPVGMMLTYGAIGIAAALARR